jgi:hypothetical protein
MTQIEMIFITATPTDVEPPVSAVRLAQASETASGSRVVKVMP